MFIDDIKKIYSDNILKNYEEIINTIKNQLIDCAKYDTNTCTVFLDKIDSKLSHGDILKIQTYFEIEGFHVTLHMIPQRTFFITGWDS